MHRRDGNANRLCIPPDQCFAVQSFSCSLSARWCPNGNLILYLHSAVRGKKLDMIRANPRVFFEMDCDLVPFEGEKPCQYGLAYSSVMGRGTAVIVEDVEEKMKAMSLLMKTQTQKDFSFNEQLVSIVSVIRIDVAEYTAKHRPIPEKLR